MRMTKQEIVKEDGRRLVYYSFDRNEHRSTEAHRNTERNSDSDRESRDRSSTGRTHR